MPDVPTHNFFPEALALSNPPLGALVIAFAAREHAKEDGLGIAFPKAFLVLPLALHPETRESIQASRSGLAAWAGRNQCLLVDFPRRAAVMSEPGRRALRFGMRYGLVQVNSGRIDVARRLPTVRDSAEEVRISVGAARKVGRWLARSDAVTSFSILGIRS